MLRNFIMPMIIGFAIGIISSIFELELVVKLLYTVSQNFLQLLLFIAPLMILIFVISGVVMLRGDAKTFFVKFIITIFITLLILSILVLFIAYLLLPHVLVPINNYQDVYLDPYFIINLNPIVNSFEAIILGIFIGAFVGPKSTTIKVVNELEKAIDFFAHKILLPLMPIWIIGTFAKTSYVNQASSIFVDDLILSAIILIIQVLFLIIMYFISTKKEQKSFKKAFKAGLKLYLKVVSIAGIGTTVIVPFAIDAQKEIGVNQAQAKIISSSSLNMPGSVISNIIFAYGIIIIFTINVSALSLIGYLILLVLATMIAPAIPGGVFSGTSTLLSPMLGFNTDQINLMGSLYYKQGTSNSAVNNAADIYLGALLD